MLFKLKNNLGYLIFCALSIVLPTIIWFFAKPLSLRFSSPYLTLTSIGQIAGLIGMAMFSLNFVLASRLRVLEEFFAGMNRVYTAHRIFGVIAFSLLL